MPRAVFSRLLCMVAANRKKQQQLYLILGAFFLCNALIAEFIGVKLFSAEKTFGFNPMQIHLFGHQLSFNMTAGVLLWPLVFITSDIINEYFGKKGVRFFSYLTAGLISYAFVVVSLSMETVPADFWIEKKMENGATLNMDLAFNAVFSQGLWIIVGSLVAFLIGQLVDVTVFQALKKKTGEKAIWLRATGSTLVSQFVDSFVVLLIAFYFSKLGTADQWPLALVLGVGVVNYIYKAVVAIVLTPVLYLAHYLIDRYLGKPLADEMKQEAMGVE